MPNLTMDGDRIIAECPNCDTSLPMEKYTKFGMLLNDPDPQELRPEDFPLEFRDFVSGGKRVKCICCKNCGENLSPYQETLDGEAGEDFVGRLEKDYCKECGWVRGVKTDRLSERSIPDKDIICPKCGDEIDITYENMKFGDVESPSNQKMK